MFVIVWALECIHAISGDGNLLINPDHVPVLGPSLTSIYGPMLLVESNFPIISDDNFGYSSNGLP